MAATAANTPFPEAAMDRYVELNRLKRLLDALAGFRLYHLALVARTVEGSIQELNCLMKMDAGKQ